MEKVNKIINSNTFINICVVGTFAALGIRSMYQQDLIEALEVERETLSKTNKAMKKSIWDCKQKLYAEASSPHTAIVPLSRLESIFGDLVTDAKEEKPAKASTKILI